MVTFSEAGASYTTAYVYMENAATGEPFTLGNLTMNHKQGELTYSPAVVEAKLWVPDPIHYPLTDQTYTVTTNQGIPGFIDDAILDGWGERFLQRMQHDPVSRFELLIRSPNSDRAGNLMTGLEKQPLQGIGRQTFPSVEGLEAFIEACEVIYDFKIDEVAAKN